MNKYIVRFEEVNIVLHCYKAELYFGGAIDCCCNDALRWFVNIISATMLISGWGRSRCQLYVDVFGKGLSCVCACVIDTCEPNLDGLGCNEACDSMGSNCNDWLGTIKVFWWSTKNGTRHSRKVGSRMKSME